jgi:hypothetical protein
MVGKILREGRVGVFVELTVVVLSVYLFIACVIWLVVTIVYGMGHTDVVQMAFGRIPIGSLIAAVPATIAVFTIGIGRKDKAVNQ